MEPPRCFCLSKARGSSSSSLGSTSLEEGVRESCPAATAAKNSGPGRTAFRSG